jgi:hypothetical protein
MAITPCGTDTALADIKEAQTALTDLVSQGSKEVLAAIKVQTDLIGAKLNSFKPEVSTNPNLRTRVQALSASPSPTVSLGLMVEIQNTFGPYVDNLAEILNEVSPDLQATLTLIQSALGSGGTVSVSDLLSGENATALLSAAAGLKTINPAGVCESCQNIEIQTDSNGNKRAVEAPEPPLVPQTQPVAAPVPSLQTLRERQKEIDARRWHRLSESAARDTMDKAIQIKRKELDEAEAPLLEKQQLYRRRLAYLSLYYNELGKIIVGDDGGIEDWPWVMKFLPLKKIEEGGVEFFGQELTFNFYDLVLRYYNENNDTDYTFEQATQLVYDAAPAELKEEGRFKPPLEVA